MQSGDLDNANKISQELSEFREKEMILKNYLIIERNQLTYENLKNQNENQIKEFNEKWDEII